ncbi:hypothetical protein Tco_1246653 [Tanacetum coccineum]
MISNRALLKNFVAKFLGIVRFGYDHFATIFGYSDLQHDNVTNKNVHFIEGLEGVDVLKGSCDSNLYQIALKKFSSKTLKSSNSAANQLPNQAEDIPSLVSNSITTTFEDAEPTPDTPQILTIQTRNFTNQ